VFLHVEKLWDGNATPMLMRAVLSGNLKPGKLVTHRSALDQILKSYDTFCDDAKHRRCEGCFEG